MQNKLGERLPMFRNRVKNKLGKTHFLYDRLGRVLNGELRRDEYLDSLDKLSWWELRQKNGFEVAVISFLTSIALLFLAIMIFAIICQF